MLISWRSFCLSAGCFFSSSSSTSRQLILYLVSFREQYGRFIDANTHTHITASSSGCNRLFCPPLFTKCLFRNLCVCVHQTTHTIHTYTHTHIHIHWFGPEMGGREQVSIQARSSVLMIFYFFVVISALLNFDLIFPMKKKANQTYWKGISRRQRR